MFNGDVKRCHLTHYYLEKVCLNHCILVELVRKIQRLLQGQNVAMVVVSIVFVVIIIVLIPREIPHHLNLKVRLLIPSSSSPDREFTLDLELLRKKFNRIYGIVETI